jgi:hypothetical protein
VYSGKLSIGQYAFKPDSAHNVTFTWWLNLNSTFTYTTVSAVWEGRGVGGVKTVRTEACFPQQCAGPWSTVLHSASAQPATITEDTCALYVCVLIQGNHLLIDISHKLRNNAVSSPIILDATPTNTGVTGYRGMTATTAFNATTATTMTANVPVIRLGW